MQTYLQQYVYAGGFMMIALIPTSLLALAWIVQGFVRLRKERILPRDLHTAAQQVSGPQDAQKFQEMLSQHRAPLARLAAHLLRLNVVGDDPRSDEAENDYVRPALSDEIDRLWQETMGLATIYAIAPLMGLLGTVIGMIRTFHEFAVNPDHSVDTLSQGINQALVTTMWGLLIAIPAYAFVQIFRRRIFRYEKDSLPQEAKTLARTVWLQADKPPKA